MEPSRYANNIQRVTWGSSANNMGMGINRQLFEDMKKCAEHFCHFDDYNWWEHLEVLPELKQRCDQS